MAQSHPQEITARANTETTNTDEGSIIYYFPCDICMDEHPAEEIYIIDECDHRFCRECMGEYVKLKIERRELESPSSSASINNDSVEPHPSDVTRDATQPAYGIRCPARGCHHIMGYSEISQCVTDTQLLETLDNIMLTRSLAQMRDLIWCPKGCGGAVAMTIPSNTTKLAPEERFVECPNLQCRLRFCIFCREPHKPKRTCAQHAFKKRKKSKVFINPPRCVHSYHLLSLPLKYCIDPLL